jgi:hypothetical protein
MAMESQKPPRNWRDVAAETAREKDPDKLAHLVKELIRALDERSERERPVSRNKSEQLSRAARPQ